jgi:hypothetical protein
MTMPSALVFEQNAHGRSIHITFLPGKALPQEVARVSRLILLAIGLCLVFSLGLMAQTSDSQSKNSQSDDTDKFWTSTTESQSDNVNPTRTTESHNQSGNRTLDKQSVQRRGSDGHFEPYQDIEKETVQVDADTVRTTTRTFGRGPDGAKTLVQVTEEEKHTLPGGDSSLVRATSNPDANGKLQVVQRQVEETKKTGKDVEETKTTVMLPSINGGMAPAMKTQEVRKLDGNETVESKKTTLLPDGSGNWQVGEVRQAIVSKEGDNRSTEERVSRPDSEGKLGEISRTVSKESGSAAGEKRNTVETFSADVPGSAGDGSLHLVERTTTLQNTSSTGQQATQRQVERRNPGATSSGLRVTTQTIDIVRPGVSGGQATRTTETHDADDDSGTVSVDTTKSDNVRAIQVQIAPAGPPK